MLKKKKEYTTSESVNFRDRDAVSIAQVFINFTLSFWNEIQINVLQVFLIYIIITDCNSRMMI